MGVSVSDLISILVYMLHFERESGKDHIRFVLKINGKIIARTKISHSWRGNKQIDDSILSLQAKQMHCSIKTLKGLLQGQLGKKDYFRELLMRGIINQDECKAMCERN